MQKRVLILLMLIALFIGGAVADTKAQCSICTRTAQQLGERPAKALNGGIIYLGLSPFLIIGFICYKWWKNNREP